ncbi:hypothetical protein ASPCAL13261 [Aspergillus calidoustus]|uniref:Alpha/beta hydrolase fold-3 domain-containing protein n=1 Tax=Aspergillus calidoustus TaxID=454130 RepID=A0A0U5GH08_ASPCI|nr:hypothetical protein ASPCAL13261 [Aspergillus calidoustus]
MAFGSLFMLWNALQEKDPPIDPATLGIVTGLTAFYPPMDATKSRAERAASNPAFVALEKKPASSSKTILDNFDRAYFWNVPEPQMPSKTYMCVSPWLAPEKIIKAALPTRIFVKLAEGVAAAARFRDLGMKVDCEVVQGVVHYWDHLAKTQQEKRLRHEVYGKAADEIAEVLEIKGTYMARF